MINTLSYDEIPRSVRVEGNTLVIDHLFVTDADAVRVVQNAETERLEDLVDAMLKIGATAMGRAQHVNDFQFVRLLADDIVQKAGSRAQEILDQTSESLQTQLNGEDGKLLEPVRKQLELVQQGVTSRLAEVRLMLDPNNPQSDLHTAISAVRQLLDPACTNSVPVKIGEIVAQITATDGALAGSVKAAVIEALKIQLEPLREQMVSLEKEVLKDKIMAETTAEVLQTTTYKGVPFEEDVLRRVKPWATAFGAETHYVGPENKPGDIVIAFTADSALGIDLRIVISAKDDATARGRKRVQDDLKKALDFREGDVGLFVGKSADAFGKEIGEWEEGSADDRPWLACTVDLVLIALRYLIVLKRLKDRASNSAALDAGAIETQIGSIRTALRRITTIKTAASSITKSVGQVTSESEQLQREIDGSLRVMECMLEA